MDADVKAKLDQMSLPCGAGWVLSNGIAQVGTIIALGSDYIEVRTDQGVTYRQANADLAYVTLL